MNQINEAAGYIQQGNRKKADQKGTKNYFLTAIKKKKKDIKVKRQFHSLNCYCCSFKEFEIINNELVSQF